MENLGYYNGRMGLIEEMMIPMNDRSTYFGDGVYEACMVHNQKIFALDDHIERFYRSFEQVKIPFKKSKEELKELLEELVQKVDGEYTLLYWQTTRGTASRAHTFPDGETPANLLITIQPTTMPDMHQRLNLCTVEDTRFFHCDVKTLNLLPNVMASEYAKQQGCDEAVFHRGEMVTECAHSNISIIKNGVFQTAPLNNMILPGIARKHMLEIASDLNIPVKEEAFTVAEMMDADEIIVSSTGLLCVGVSTIDGKSVGNKDTKTFEAIQNRYIERFEEETSK